MQEKDVVSKKVLKERKRLWNKLTEKQRVDRIVKAFNVIEKILKKQLTLLKQLEKGDTSKLDERYQYFYRILKSIWENTKFAISLGKGKNRKYSFYPARTVMENTFRLEYFTRQDNIEKQKDIAIVECLRISKRFYDFEISTGKDGQQYKDFYDSFNREKKFPAVHEVLTKDLNPVPLWQLIQKTKISGGKQWYFCFQALSELVHGKHMALVMMDQNEIGEYRRSLMYLLLMCFDVLRNTDCQLKRKTQKEVDNCICQAEAIIWKPIKD